jgi:hypothetical protein
MVSFRNLGHANTLYQNKQNTHRRHDQYVPHVTRRDVAGAGVIKSKEASMAEWLVRSAAYR